MTSVSASMLSNAGAEDSADDRPAELPDGLVEATTGLGRAAGWVAGALDQVPPGVVPVLDAEPGEVVGAAALPGCEGLAVDGLESDTGVGARRPADEGRGMYEGREGSGAGGATLPRGGSTLARPAVGDDESGDGGTTLARIGIDGARGAGGTMLLRATLGAGGSTLARPAGGDGESGGGGREIVEPDEASGAVDARAMSALDAAPALDGLARPALDVPALDAAPALDVPALDAAPALDVPALDVPALDVTALDVTALDVTALDVTALDAAPALDVPALDAAPALDVPALDVPALDAAPALGRLGGTDARAAGGAGGTVLARTPRSKVSRAAGSGGGFGPADEPSRGGGRSLSSVPNT